MSTPFYFGYGSLVNDETLPSNARWQLATLGGWRRAWRHPVPGSAPWAAMDVFPDPGSSIDGLLVTGGSDIDGYLIQRESGYSAHDLTHASLQLTQPLPTHATPYLWTSQTPTTHGENPYLMQSYVDVVMAGYLRHFGEAGLQRFVETTDNWHLTVFDDRDNPRYPRAVTLTQEEQAVIGALQPSA